MFCSYFVLFVILFYLFVFVLVCLGFGCYGPLVGGVGKRGGEVGGVKGTAVPHGILDKALSLPWGPGRGGYFGKFHFGLGRYEVWVRGV